MGLTSWVFLLFCVVLMIIYWISGSKIRDLLLLAAGFTFYGYAASEHIPVIFILTLITFFFGWYLDKTRAAGRNPYWSAALGVSVVLFFLVYFKYSVLILNTWNSYAKNLGFTVQVPKVVAPLAISFLVFQFISYLVDKYRGIIKGNSLKVFLLYTWFFPTMLAGPIKRYDDFAPQVNGVRFDFNSFSLGLSRVLIGLFKKIVIADTFTLWSDKLLNPQMNSGIMLLIAVYCYSMKIYFDFSGYSDIAIGLARMLGYRIPENFNWPYLADSIADFWRRWHISLSTWIRDYLFIPLGGSRVSYSRHFLNALIAMGLSGLWHGASWTFLVWGLWHGIALGIYGIYKRSGVFSALKNNLIWKTAGWFVTFNFVSLGWIFFASKSLSDSVLIFKRIISIMG